MAFGANAVWQPTDQPTGEFRKFDHALNRSSDSSDLPRGIRRAFTWAPIPLGIVLYFLVIALDDGKGAAFMLFLWFFAVPIACAICYMYAFIFCYPVILILNSYGKLTTKNYMVGVGLPVLAITVLFSSGTSSPTWWQTLVTSSALFVFWMSSALFIWLFANSDRDENLKTPEYRNPWQR